MSERETQPNQDQLIPQSGREKAFLEKYGPKYGPEFLKRKRDAEALVRTAVETSEEKVEAILAMKDEDLMGSLAQLDYFMWAEQHDMADDRLTKENGEPVSEEEFMRSMLAYNSEMSLIAAALKEKNGWDDDKLAAEMLVFAKRTGAR